MVLLQVNGVYESCVSNVWCLKCVSFIFVAVYTRNWESFVINSSVIDPVNQLLWYVWEDYVINSPVIDPVNQLWYPRNCELLFIAADESCHIWQMISLQRVYEHKFLVSRNLYYFHWCNNFRESRALVLRSFYYFHWCNNLMESLTNSVRIKMITFILTLITVSMLEVRDS